MTPLAASGYRQVPASRSRSPFRRSCPSMGKLYLRRAVPKLALRSVDSSATIS